MSKVCNFKKSPLATLYSVIQIVSISTCMRILVIIQKLIYGCLTVFLQGEVQKK